MYLPSPEEARVSVSPRIARIAPRLPPPGEGLRRMLACPGALIEGPAVDAPHESVAARHARLLQTAAGPEGWLALQPGLATVSRGGARGWGWTSFVHRGRTALAVGGVHGADRRAAYEGFREATADLGIRRQAVYPLRAFDLGAAHAAGFETLPIAVEAWVDLGGFTLRGKSWAHLRQMRNRAVRHGVAVEEATDGWRKALEETWRAFLAARDTPWQIRWLSGGPIAGPARGRRTFVAHRDGAVQAFCTVLPGPDGQAALDVMCRHPAARPGAMEGLLVAVLTRLREEGLTWVSLGPCPLAGGSVDGVPGALGAGLRWAIHSELGDRWFGFGRLAAFKAKFQPRYEVVHLGVAPRLSLVTLYLVARIWALGA